MSDTNPSPPTPPPSPIDERLYCPHCAYNLTGLSESQCPECGTPFDRKRLRREAMKWAAPYLGRLHIVLLLLAPAAVVVGEWIFTLDRGNNAVAKQVMLSGLIFAVIAAAVVGRRAARTFARHGTGDLATPATRLKTVIYAGVVLCLEVALMFFAFFGTCGTICACGAFTRRF